MNGKDACLASHAIPPVSIGGQNIYDPGVFIRPTIDLDTKHAPAGTKLIVAFEDNYAHEVHTTSSLDGGTSFTPHQNITNTASVSESNPKVKFHFYVDSDYALIAFNTGGAPIIRSIIWLPSTSSPRSRRSIPKRTFPACPAAISISKGNLCPDNSSTRLTYPG